MAVISNSKVYSVGELTQSVKRTVEGNTALSYVRVEGELSNVTRKPGRFGGDYLYFTLKDSSAQLSAVMFEGVRELEFEPSVGTSVICEGKITVYAPYGKYQLQCYAMSESGEGAAARALEQLKGRLLAEGLFDKHRALPKFPKKIAVVTSATGAVRHDIESVIARRYPLAELCVIPAAVQGENAVPTLIAGLERAQNVGADIIIFGRGGGSNEDLDCFNSEALARAIYASEVPTISAVGHQVDYTIADLTADVRAATPSAAAELAVPDILELLGDINSERELAKSLVMRAFSNAELRLSVFDKEVRLYSPHNRIEIWERELSRQDTAISAEIKRKLELADADAARLRAEISYAVHRKIESAEAELREAARSVSDLNPMGVLARGYSVTKSGGKVITDAKLLKKGDIVEVKPEKGAFTASVIDIKG